MQAEKESVARLANLPRRSTVEDVMRALDGWDVRKVDVMREYDEQLRPSAFYVKVIGEENSKRIEQVDGKLVGTRTLRIKSMSDLPDPVRQTLEHIERGGPVENCIVVTNVPTEASEEDIELLFHGFHLQGDVILYQDNWKKKVESNRSNQRNSTAGRRTSHRALVRLESPMEVYRALLERHNRYVCNRSVQLHPLI